MTDWREKAMEWTIKGGGSALVTGLIARLVGFSEKIGIQIVQTFTLNRGIKEGGIDSLEKKHDLLKSWGKGIWGDFGKAIIEFDGTIIISGLILWLVCTIMLMVHAFTSSGTRKSPQMPWSDIQKNATHVFRHRGSGFLSLCYQLYRRGYTFVTITILVCLIAIELTGHGVWIYFAVVLLVVFGISYFFGHSKNFQKNSPLRRAVLIITAICVFGGIWIFPMRYAVEFFNPNVEIRSLEESPGGWTIAKVAFRSHAEAGFKYFFKDGKRHIDYINNLPHLEGDPNPNDYTPLRDFIENVKPPSGNEDDVEAVKKAFDAFKSTKN